MVTMEKLASIAATAAVNKIADSMTRSKRQKRRDKAKAKKARGPPPKVNKPLPRPPTRKTLPPLPKERVYSVPARTGYSFKTKPIQANLGKFRGRDSMRLTGSDFWGLVQTRTNGKYIDMVNMPLNPTAVLNTRIQVEATLWTKFHYHSLVLEYIPNVSTSTNGSILMTHTDDPELRIPGNQGSLQYVTALFTVDDAKVVPCYEKGSHKISGSTDSKHEFYIQPDFQDETRLTVQGMAKMIQMTNDNPSGAEGFLMVHYDVTLYDKVVAVSNQGFLSLPVITSTPSTGQVKLLDQGILAGLQLSVGPLGSTLIETDTLYAVYFNFELGGLLAMDFYWWKTPTTFDGVSYTTLYSTINDAENVTGENVVSGSWLATGIVPTNATIYFTPASSLSDPSLRARRGVALEETVSELEARLKRLTKAFEDSQNNNNSKTSPLIRKVL